MIVSSNQGFSIKCFFNDLLIQNEYALPFYLNVNSPPGSSLSPGRRVDGFASHFPKTKRHRMPTMIAIGNQSDNSGHRLSKTKTAIQEGILRR
jgi:hypothetical protein